MWFTERLLPVLALLLGAGVLRAQQVRGVVRDSTAAAPLPGAVVSVVDSAGQTLQRTIADGAGRFTLGRPPRAARLRVIRIGYQPHDVTFPAGPGDASVVLSLLAIPPMLDAVRVSDQELCPGSTDRTGAFLLWEQARAGLLAAIVARDANPAIATTLLYERSTAPATGLVLNQTMTPRSGRTTRPFIAARAPSVFAARGYMEEDATGRTFNGPDADVLFDESFAATHCFHLRIDDEHVGEVGLAFAPLARDTLVNVSGVLWMDAARPELRALDFRFTELEPAAMIAGAGGHLEFHTVENGVSFIERWALRLPVMSPIPASSSRRQSVPGTNRRQDRLDLRVDRIHENGGVLLEAKWSDGTSWHEPATGIAGVATQRGSGAPIANAIVTLRGTADSVTTDVTGAFSMTPLIPGRYAIAVADTSLALFLAERVEQREIDVRRGGMSAYTPSLIPQRELTGRLCKGQASLSRTTAVAGRVVFADRELLRHAALHTDWQATYNNGSMVELNGSGNAPTAVVNGAQQAVDLDDRGRFILCGVARERPVHLHVVTSEGFADTTIVVRDSVLQTVEWMATPRHIVAPSGRRPKIPRWTARWMLRNRLLGWPDVI